MDFDFVVELLVPLGVCVVLPVMMVWLIGRVRQNETNKKAEVMLKAIESGVQVDMDQFKAQKKSPKSIKQELLDKLNGACICGLIGLFFLTFYIVRLFNPAFGGNMFGSYLLPAGGILLAVGLGLLISYLAGKKLLAKEIEAEEKALQQ